MNQPSSPLAGVKPTVSDAKIDTWLQLGRELYKSGDYEAARELFDLAPERFLDNNDWVKLFRSVAVKLG